MRLDLIVFSFVLSLLTASSVMANVDPDNNNSKGEAVVAGESAPAAEAEPAPQTETPPPVEETSGSSSVTVKKFMTEVKCKTLLKMTGDEIGVGEIKTISGKTPERPSGDTAGDAIETVRVGNAIYEFVDKDASVDSVKALQNPLILTFKKSDSAYCMIKERGPDGKFLARIFEAKS